MRGSLERVMSSLKQGQVTAFLKDCLSDSRKRIYVYIISGILLLAVLLGIMAALKSRSSKELSGTLGEGEKKAAQSLTYLPDTEREKEGQGNDSTASLRDPFTGAVVLKGVIKGGDKDFAIIEAGQVAYVVSKGDSVAGIWTVKGIEKDNVVLASGRQELRLGFSGRLKSVSEAGTAGESGNNKAEGNGSGQSQGSTAGRNGGEL